MLKLNFGSGTVRLREDYINLDMDIRTKPDVMGDILSSPFADDSVDNILMAHTIEHFSDLWVIRYVIPEVWRVLKVGGEFECIAPIAGSFASFQDPDHKSYWVPQKFLYFTPHFRDIVFRPDYEQRFQLTHWEYDSLEVKVKMTKITSWSDECCCPLCQ